MKRIFRSVLACLLAIVMTVGSAPLAGFVGLELPEWLNFGSTTALTAEAVDYRGKCGDNLYWEFNESSGELIISGTGEMSFDDYRPWNLDGIKTVTLEEGVTTICKNAFSYATGLSTLNISSSVSKIPAQAFQYTYLSVINLSAQNNYFSLDENGVLFDKNKTELVLFPSEIEIEDYTIPDGVKKIADYAFCDSSYVSNVYLPSSLEYIGNYAFYSSSVSYLSIPSEVSYIGEKAFSGCTLNVETNNGYYSTDERGVLFDKDKTKLIQYPAKCKETSYVIPDSVETIEDEAFYYSYHLKEVTFSSNLKEIGDSAFESCSLEEIYLPDSLIIIGDDAFRGNDDLYKVELGDGVTTIGNWAFGNCDIGSIIFPNSLISIGDYAFYNNYWFQIIFIGDGLESIGENAFDSCSKLGTIKVSENNQHFYCDSNGVLFNKEKTKIVYYPKTITNTSYDIPNGVTEIGSYAFKNCKYLQNISIPETVVKISNSAFEQCGNLTEINIPDSVETIGDWAFGGCEKASAVTIGNHVEIIGNYAFSHCAMQVVTIPDSVKYVGEGAFYACQNLTTITVPDNVSNLGSEVFAHCRNLTEVYIGKGVTDIGESAFWCCDSLEQISVNEANAYYLSDKQGVLFNKSKTELLLCPQKSKITTYTIPESVVSISDSAFYNCSDLVNISVPKGLKSIGKQAFEDCISLTGFIIPNGVKEIGYSTFSDCNSLKTISIGSGVEVIGYSAFENCLSLESVIIPDSVKHLDDYAFYGCTSLKCLSIGKGLERVGEWVFADCYALTEVLLQSDKMNIGWGMFNCCFELETIDIPDGVERIGSNAFRWCDKLNTISIPKTVTYIDDYAIESLTTILCYKNTAGYNYAIENGNNYILLPKLPILNISANCNGNDYVENTLVKDSVGITVTNKEKYTGDVTYYYSTDGKNFTEFGGDLYISEDTDATYTFTATNEEGEYCEAPVSLKVRIDCTAPTGKIEIGNSKWKETWTSFLENITFGVYTNETVSVKITGEDNSSEIINSGVKKIEYIKSRTSLTASQLRSSKAWVEGDSFEVKNDEAFFVYARITDKAGNTSIISGSKNSGVIVDKTPPELSSNYKYNGVWTNNDIDIDGVYTADISGLNKITYSIDGAEAVNISTNPISWRVPCSAISEGDHNIVITADDKAGNSKSITVNVKKDVTAPVIESVTDNQTGEWVHSATVTVNANELLSGLQANAYSFDGGKTWQASNSKTYQKNQVIASNSIKVIDIAGNIASYENEVEIKWVDNDAPVIAEVNGNPVEWKRGTATLVIDATDYLCGLADEPYSFDGGITWQAENSKVYYENQTIAANTIQVRDKIGNTAKYGKIVISKLDNTAPVISGVSGNPQNWVNTDVTLTINASDNLSGLAAKPYSFDGGETWQSANQKSYSQNTTVVNDTIWVKDAVGNIAKYQPEIKISKIDKISPTVSEITVSQECLKTIITIVGAKDNESGLTPNAYSFDAGKSWQSSNIKVFTEKTEIDSNQIMVRDIAGNVCSNDSEINVVILGHNYSDWIIDKDETCTENGEKHRVCSRCSAEENASIVAPGHSYSEWKIVTESTVLQEGLKERTCKSCKNNETEKIDKIYVDINADKSYGLCNFTVLNAQTLKPISDAKIDIVTDNDGKCTLTTNAEGKVSQALPVGKQTISVCAEGCQIRNISINVKPGEQNISPIGLSGEDMIDVDITVEEMTMEDIIEAGISTAAGANNHYYRYEAEVKFEASVDTKSIISFFGDLSGLLGSFSYNSQGTPPRSYYPGGSDYNPADWTYYPPDEGVPVPRPGNNSSGVTPDDEEKSVVYPVSENFYLIVHGEAKWLKEMYDVELLVINKSMTDTIENCTAELILPEGLSLAAMIKDEQSLTQVISHIGEGEQKSIHWYIRGDEEGDYNISAKLTGTFMPFEENFDIEYTTKSPIKVYAGSALHLTFEMPRQTYYGDDFPIKVTLENVSHKTLYNVRHSLSGITQGQVTYYSDGTVKEMKSVSSEVSWEFVDEMKPGDKIVFETTTKILFESEVIEHKLEELIGIVDNIEMLVQTYKMFKNISSALSACHSFFVSANNHLDSAINLNFWDDQAKKQYSSELLGIFKTFIKKFEAGDSEAVALMDELKSTGLYDDVMLIAEDPNFFAVHDTTEILSILNSARAADRKLDNKEYLSSNFNIYDSIRTAISLIPITFLVDEVIITTLNGSTTEIPYSIKLTDTEARYFGVENVSKYLMSLVVAACGKVDPSLTSFVFDKFTGMSYEDAIEYITMVEKDAAQFAVVDTDKNTSYSAWIETKSKARTVGKGFTLSVDNDSAEMINGKLCFTGGGILEVVANEVGFGVLYIEDSYGNISEFNLSVVEEHVCSSDDWTTVIAPSEDHLGFKVKCCKVCNGVLDQETVVACESHTYGDAKTEYEVTCVDAGLVQKICVDCGYKCSEVVLPSGHTPEWDKADYNHDGSCDYCGKLIDYIVLWIIDDTEVCQKYNFGNEIVKWDAPVKGGFYFVGWTPEVPETMPAQSLTFMAVFEKLPTVTIGNPTQTTIKYGDSIILHANINGKLQQGFTVVWESDNSNFDMQISSDGTICTITPSSSGDTTFTVTVYDENGNEISKDTQTMKSKAGFFDKFVAFFKKLFGLTKVIQQSIYTIY